MGKVCVASGGALGHALCEISQKIYDFTVAKLTKFHTYMSLTNYTDVVEMCASNHVFCKISQILLQKLQILQNFPKNFVNFCRKSCKIPRK